jgi:hypothetical protein
MRTQQNKATASTPLISGRSSAQSRRRGGVVIAVVVALAVIAIGYVAGSSYGSSTLQSKVFVPGADFTPPTTGGQLPVLVSEPVATWLPIPPDIELGVFTKLEPIPEQDTMEAQSFFSPSEMDAIVARYMSFLREEGWAVSNVARTEFGHDAAWIPAVTFGALRTGEELNFTVAAGLSAGERLPDGYNSTVIVWRVTRETTPEEIRAFNGFGD